MRKLLTLDIFSVMIIGAKRDMFAKVRTEFEEHNIVCHAADTSAKAIKALMTDRYHLTLIVMSKENKETVLEQIAVLRSITTTPIAALSTEAFNKELRIQTLEAGADQLHVMPESVTELVAIGRALIRRYTELNNKAAPKPTVVTDRDLYFCLEHRTVRIRGREIDLTPKEFEILRLLITHPRIVYSHQMLVQEVWGEEYITGSKKTVSNRVISLRGKLKTEPDVPDYIQNIHGVGFKYAPLD